MPETLEDPTRTTTLRKRFKRDFRSRWRSVRGDLRGKLLDDGLLERIRSNRSISSYEFRQYLKRTLDDDLYEPLSSGEIERGNHWTATYIRDAYAAGLDRAQRQLADQYDADVVDAATTRHHDAHQTALESEYGAAYTDVEDAYFAVVTDVTREFRALVEEGDETDREVVSAVNERIDSAGVHRTEAAAANRVVEAYNGALLVAYGIAGVERVGRIPETQPDDESGEVTTNYAHEHGHNHDHDLERQNPLSGDGFIDRVFDPPRSESEDRGLRVHLDLSSVAERAKSAVSSLRGDSPNVAGDPSGEQTVQWWTAQDDKVCEECLSYSADVVSYEAVTSGSVPFPPIHPNCRCVLVPVSTDQD